jgi:cytochrome c-type biogenesis protein CcsB
MMHVTIMILSYASLIIGSLFAILFLVISFYEENLPSEDNNLPSEKRFSIKKDNINEKNGLNSPSGEIVNQKLPQLSTITLSSIAPAQLSNTYSNNNSLLLLRNVRKLKILQKGNKINYSSLNQNLDNLSYRILGIGFPLLTIGILSGAVWANEAWGSYWSWDPKETWALITWLTYAIYLHTRITNGWSGKKPAIIASIGFIIVWICYLGVNLLGKGLHSYGWVQSLNNFF